MIKNILLINVLILLLSSCEGGDGISDFEKAQAEPGWKESGLYAENQGGDNKHLSDMVGVKSKLFVRTGEGLVYTKNDSNWELLGIPGGKKADYIETSEDLLIVAMEEGTGIYSYNPLSEDWKSLESPLERGLVIGIVPSSEGFFVAMADLEAVEDTTKLWHRIFSYDMKNFAWEEITANWPYNERDALANDNFHTGFEHEQKLYVGTWYHDMLSYTKAEGWIQWERGEERISNVKEVVYWEEAPVSIHLQGEVIQRSSVDSRVVLDSGWIQVKDGVESVKNTAPHNLYMAINYGGRLIVGGGGPAIPMVKVEGRNWKRISEETMCPYVEERSQRDCLGLWSTIYDMEVVGDKFYVLQSKRLIEMELSVLDSLIQE